MERMRRKRSYKTGGILEEVSLDSPSCEVVDANLVPMLAGETLVGMHALVYVADCDTRTVKTPISACSMMKEVARTRAILREHR
jgi:hypothetical protein